MVRYLSMDILATETELMAHQVNCKGVMGCELAGGDQKVVHEIIRDIFTPSEITVYICKK